MSMEEWLRNVEVEVGLRTFGPYPQRAGVDGVLHLHMTTPSVGRGILIAETTSSLLGILSAMQDP